MGAISAAISSGQMSLWVISGHPADVPDTSAPAPQADMVATIGHVS